MKKIVLIISLVVMVSLLSTSLFAQHMKDKDQSQMKARQEMKQDMKEDMKLTADQESKMEALHMNHKKEMIKIEADIDTKEVDLKAAMKSDDFAKAKQLTSEIARLKESIALKRIDMMEGMSKILTKEQREMMKDRHSMMGDRMGKDNCEMGKHEMKKDGDCGNQCDEHKGPDRKMMKEKSCE